MINVLIVDTCVPAYLLIVIVESVYFEQSNLHYAHTNGSILAGKFKRESQWWHHGNKKNMNWLLIREN